MATFAAAVKTWCLDLLFPKFCLNCGQESAFLCPACRELLRQETPSCPVCSYRNFTGILCDLCAEQTGLRRFLAPFSYSDPLIRELIHAYKYSGARELAGLFADEITLFLDEYAIRPPPSAVLVPVPLHRSRERERGFNQSALLARELCQRLNLQMSSALRRRWPTESQIEMESYDRRRANVAGAFGLRKTTDVEGRTAILIDDVSTSGATLYEAARVLRAAGARTVWAIAIAKG